MKRLLVVMLIGLAAAVSPMLGQTSAEAWCLKLWTPYGSGLQSFGEEYVQYSSTCDGDSIYKGKVRDHPTYADGYCAHARLNSGGGWFTQGSSCTATWVNYSVWNTYNYSTKLCKGTSSVCVLGSLTGA